MQPLVNNLKAIAGRPWLLSWALVAALLFAQVAGSAHKAQLDGHEPGQLCHACILFDRDDLAPPAAAFELPAPDLVATSVFRPSAESRVEFSRVTPPARGPPQLIV